MGEFGAASPSGPSTNQPGWEARFIRAEGTGVLAAGVPARSAHGAARCCLLPAVPRAKPRRGSTEPHRAGAVDEHPGVLFSYSAGGSAGAKSSLGSPGGSCTQWFLSQGCSVTAWFACLITAMVHGNQACVFQAFLFV